MTTPFELAKQQHFKNYQASYGESDHAIFKAGWESYPNPEEEMIDPFSGAFCIHYAAGYIYRQQYTNHLFNKKVNNE